MLQRTALKIPEAMPLGSDGLSAIFWGQYKKQPDTVPNK